MNRSRVYEVTIGVGGVKGKVSGVREYHRIKGCRKKCSLLDLTYSESNIMYVA